MTRRQRDPQIANRIIRFFQDYRRLHDSSPTIREVARAMEVSSTSVITYHLIKLARAGRLTHTPNRARSFNLPTHATDVASARALLASLAKLSHLPSCALLYQDAIAALPAQHRAAYAYIQSCVEGAARPDVIRRTGATTDVVAQVIRDLVALRLIDSRRRAEASVVSVVYVATPLASLIAPAEEDHA